MVRIGASLIDTALLLAITIPVLTIIYGKDYRLMPPFEAAGGWDTLRNWVFPAIAIILFWIYRQATPGKMILGAKIVDEKTGAAVNTKQLIIRYIHYYLSTIVFLLGLLWVT